LGGLLRHSKGLGPAGPAFCEANHIQ
jgi:hypothetical protein